MTQGVCEEYEARHEENLRTLRYARTREERRAIDDIIEEDFASHFRLSNEDRQNLHETVVIQRGLLKWGWPLLILPIGCSGHGTACGTSLR